MEGSSCGVACKEGSGSSSAEVREQLARLALACEHVSGVADSADNVSHMLRQVIDRHPELGGADTQMLGLLLREMAGRLEQLAAAVMRFSHRYEDVVCHGPSPSDCL